MRYLGRFRTFFSLFKWVSIMFKLVMLLLFIDLIDILNFLYTGSNDNTTSPASPLFMLYYSCDSDNTIVFTNALFEHLLYYVS